MGHLARFVFTLGIAAILASAAAAGDADLPDRIPLREVMQLAVERHPEVVLAEADVRSARSAQDLARAARLYPRLAGTGVVGVVPAARGDIFYSPDSSTDLTELGPFWRLRLELSMPIFTFGQLGSLERAAGAAATSREARLESREREAKRQAMRAYFGYLLAASGLNLIAEVRGRLQRLIASLEHAETGHDDSDPAQIYRVRYHGLQLDMLESQAQRELAEAAAGLRELAGRSVRPAAEDLPALLADETGLDEALGTAVANSAEVREAERAADARDFLARAAAGERAPSVGFEGRFDYGRAPNRTPQHNPFAYDVFNVRTLTAALAVRWDLSLKQGAAREARASAEAAAAHAAADGLRARVRLETVRQHARLVEARTNHETGLKAVGTTGNWLRVAEENQSLGTGSTKDLVDAYAANAQSRAALLKALCDLDVAVVDWRLALGHEPLRAEENP